MSESKEENSTPATEVKEEDESKKSEDNKTQDESSEEKDSAKDSVKDESEKGSDEEEEEEEEVGLLDRPVEVFGCRARKQVERLEVSFSSKDKQMEIPEGKGEKLGSCPRIEFNIAKKSANDLKPLHRILFNRVGAASGIKKNIRKFSGFTFSKDSTEYNKKKGQTEKFTLAALRKVCEILDVERKGTKEDMVNRILEFLLQPKDSGKKVPKAKPSPKDKKKGVEKKNAKKGKTKKEASSGEDSNSADGSEQSNGDAEEEESNDKDEDGDSEEEEEPPKNTKPAKGKKAPAKPVAKKAEKKEKPKKEEKKAPKATKRKRDEDSSDHSDEEPSSKKAKMPSDEEIKKLVKRILDAADLQEITMKKVIKQVSDAYPDSDLSHKKAFIKSTIKSVIS